MVTESAAVDAFNNDALRAGLARYLSSAAVVLRSLEAFEPPFQVTV
jgi:hypothetical protein